MLLSDLLKYSKYKNLCESFTQDSLFRKYTKWYKDHELYLKYKLPTYNYRYFPGNGDLIQLYSNSFSKYDQNIRDYDSKEAFEETSYGSEKTRKRMLVYDIQERFYKSFIQLFHGIFPELKNVSINEISQEDIIEIPVEKARSKKYENCYMFWEDNEGNLVALSKENRIKALFYSYGKCYKVNKDYKCQDIKGLIEDCDNDVYEAAKLYVEEAFKIEDIYDIAVDIKEIKQLMKNNNVINLQKANEPDAYAGDLSTIRGYRWLEGISKVYGIDAEVFAKKTNSEKIKSRQEYKEFLKNQMYALEGQVKRYERTAARMRYDREYENTIEAMNNAMKEIKSGMRLLRRIQLTHLLDDTYRDTVVKKNYSDDLDDSMGESFKRINEFYISLARTLTDIQYEITEVTKEIQNNATPQIVYMYLKRVKSLIENYNDECIKITSNYSYYSRAFRTLKLILTPEEVTEILKIEDTGIYTIVKKKKEQ